MAIERYGDHDLQTIKVFNYSSSNKGNVILIHGGAWRDPNNTYDDFIGLAQHLQTHTNFNVFGINYRLSPEVKHPEHINDVWLAIQHIQKKYPGELSLVGHSVGATLILQLLNWKSFINKKTLQEEDDKLQISTAVFLDGIFDVPELIEEYPSYIGFVEEAFGGDAQYTQATQLSWNVASSFDTVPTKSLVLHSLQDELLSTHQTELFTKFLDERGINNTTKFENWGAHEEVYRRDEVASIIAEHL